MHINMDSFVDVPLVWSQFRICQRHFYRTLVICVLFQLEALIKSHLFKAVLSSVWLRREQSSGQLSALDVQANKREKGSCKIWVQKTRIAPILWLETLNQRILMKYLKQTSSSMKRASKSTFNNTSLPPDIHNTCHRGSICRSETRKNITTVSR